MIKWKELKKSLKEELTKDSYSAEDMPISLLTEENKKVLTGTPVEKTESKKKKPELNNKEDEKGFSDLIYTQ